VDFQEVAKMQFIKAGRGAVSGLRFGSGKLTVPKTDTGGLV
jgi:hypothetical protein